MNNDKLVCPICGEPTYLVYGKNPRKDRLCGKHSQMLFNKEIAQCSDCGEWYETAKNCSCKTQDNKSNGEKSSNEDSLCIICGTPSNGKPFCYNCYKDVKAYYKEIENLEDLQQAKEKYLKTKNNGTLFGELKKIKEKCKMLYAIAERIDELNGFDNYQTKIGVQDINSIISRKIEIENRNDEIIKNSKEKDVAPQQKMQEIEEKKIIVVNEENKSRCITCGKKTDGLLFCTSCYHKYNKKELLFRITGCSSVELLDENYEGRFICKDGHVVKSKSEREIDNYLFENGIPHAYEKTLSYGKTEKEVLHPDFYLPHYLGANKHVYLEHWGFDDNNRDYTKTKKFKLPIYEKLGITLICTYEKTDTGDIDAALDRKLNKENITENAINYK